MEYELAKQLKDAGFPRIKDETDEGLRNYPPTLEELIEACGDDLISIERVDGGWQAKSFKDASGELAHNAHALNSFGATPTEAVAMLYLALYGDKTRPSMEGK